MKRARMERALIIISVLLLGFMIGHSFGYVLRQDFKEVQPCDCTVNINGSIMSVEDGFYYLLEGLSADQADEVQIMINNSLGK